MWWKKSRTSTASASGLLKSHASSNIRMMTATTLYMDASFLEGIAVDAVRSKKFPPFLKNNIREPSFYERNDNTISSKIRL
jgi:hypothetical protein